jgi:hypothetical protein
LRVVESKSTLLTRAHKLHRLINDFIYFGLVYVRRTLIQLVQKLQQPFTCSSPPVIRRSLDSAAQRDDEFVTVR